MKKIILLVPCLLIAFLMPALAQETKSVTAEGVASLGSDPAAARDKAIEDALRRAVEQAVGTMVESETTVENYQLLSDRIYSRSSGYVKNYNVVSENREGGLLRVKISAEVDTGDLNSDLAAIGLLQRRMKYPRVMVMIAEENILSANFWELYSTTNSQTEATVIGKLKQKGFNVVEPNLLRRTVAASDARAALEGDYDIAGTMGTKLGAEVVIVGKATSTRAPENIAGSQLLSASSSITAMAVKAGTGEIIAQASSTANAAHINEVAAIQEALRKASDKLADDLMAGILQQWQQESSGSRTLVVQVQDVNAADLDKLKAAFEKIRGVTQVMVRNFSNGSADMDIQSRADAQDLSATIAKTKFPGFRLVLLDSSMDRLEYRIVR